MQHPDVASHPFASDARSAIARLPDDTLYAVFEVLRGCICFPGESEDVPYDPLPKAYRRDKALTVSRGPKVPLWTLPIVLSHVCARWRAFALASPRLWSFIRVTGSFSNRLMLAMFLERSQQMPLSVLLTKPAAPTDKSTPGHNFLYNLLALTSEVADLVVRIRELGVVLPRETARLVLDALADSPVPHLEKLWLDVGLENHGDLLPIHVLNVNPLSVRTLHARQMPMSWLPFEGLIRLELSSGPRPSLPALLFTLKNSPGLEVLQLRIPSFRADDAVPDGEVPVELANLRELLLSVVEGDSGAFDILPHITFSPTTEIDLHFTGRRPACLYEQNEPLRKIALSVKDVSIHVDPLRGATIESADPPVIVDYDGTFFAREGLPIHKTQVHEGLLAFPLPALEHALLSVYDWVDDPLPFQWRFNHLFSTLPTITHLRTTVHTKYVPYIAAALNGPEDEEGRMRCSKLRRWTIAWCGEEPSVDDFWIVERCCARRASEGVPLDTLETSVAVPDFVLDSLQRSVRIVSVLEDF